MTKREKEVNTFNKKYKIGIDGILEKDSGEKIKTKTRSEAWLMGGSS